MEISLKPGRRLSALSAVLVVLVAAGPVMADDQATTGSEMLAPASAPVAAPSNPLEPRALFATAIPVSDEALGAESGKALLQMEKVVINTQELNGTLQGNIATGTTNGDNSISGEAFGNVAGFVTAIQNTGNNVLIQDATIINISMAP